MTAEDLIWNWVNGHYGGDDGSPPPYRCPLPYQPPSWSDDDKPKPIHWELFHLVDDWFHRLSKTDRRVLMYEYVRRRDYRGIRRRERYRKIAWTLKMPIGELEDRIEKLKYELKGVYETRQGSY